MVGLPDIISLGGNSNCGTTEQDNLFKCLDKQYFRGPENQENHEIIRDAEDFSDRLQKLFQIKYIWGLIVGSVLKKVHVVKVIRYEVLRRVDQKRRRRLYNMVTI